MRVYLTLKKRTNKEGLSEVYIVVYAGRGQRKLIKTDVKVKPELWNEEKREVRRGHPHNVSLNQLLWQKRNEIELKIRTGQLQNPKFDFDDFIFMVDGVRPGSSKSQDFSGTNRKIGFWQAYDDFVERLTPNVGRSTIKDYHSLKKHLKLFEKKMKTRLSFQSMTYAFYESFMHYLLHDAVKRNGELGLSKNYQGKLVKNLKVFLRKAMLRGECELLNLEGWKVETEKVDSIYLDEQEIEKMWQLDYSKKPVLELARDLFVVGCETGLRVSDFSSNLRFMVGKDNLLRFTVLKTMQSVVIPISPRLQVLLDKYDYVFPPFNSVRFNREIKKIAQDAGLTDYVQMRRTVGGKKTNEWYQKWELVVSHTCRRSFCTNAYKRGWPAPVIRQVSGHTTDSALMRYIKVDVHEAAEELLRLMGLDDKVD